MRLRDGTNLSQAGEVSAQRPGRARSEQETLNSGNDGNGQKPVRVDDQVMDGDSDEEVWREHDAGSTTHDGRGRDAGGTTHEKGTESV